MVYEILVTPNTKPRMTRADKWKKTLTRFG